MFFDLILFNQESLKKTSLNDLCMVVNDDYDKKIEKQSLNERFNEKAVIFLMKILQQLLQKQLILEKSGLSFQKIQRLLIKDSVCFQIDSSLSEHYQGSGGSGSKAAIRIQFEYCALSGVITDLSLHAFNEQDAINSKATAHRIEKKDLIVRDLAYMSLSVLKSIMNKQAYFLCRANTNIKIYEKNKDGFTELDFIKIRRYIKEHNLSFWEREVYLGAKDKLPVRLVIQPVSDDETNRRIRRARAYNKRTGGGEPTKKYKSRAALNLFITNATEDILSTKLVVLGYQIRWQIELVFKVWKSLCNIDKVKKVKLERLQCYIYAKFIFIVFNWRLIWMMAAYLRKEEHKNVSLYKAFKLTTGKLNEATRMYCLHQEINHLYYLSRLYKSLKERCIVERKQNKSTLSERLLLITKNYEKQKLTSLT